VCLSQNNMAALPLNFLSAALCHPVLDVALVRRETFVGREIRNGGSFLRDALFVLFMTYFCSAAWLSM